MQFLATLLAVWVPAAVGLATLIPGLLHGDAHRIVVGLLILVVALACGFFFRQAAKARDQNKP